MQELDAKYDITRLYKDQETRDALRMRSCKEILRRIHNRIDLIVKHGHRTDTSCIFEVPYYLVGYPVYKIEETVKFLFNSLVNEGFYAKMVDERNIYISWDRKDIEKFVKAQVVEQVLSASGSVYASNGNGSANMQQHVRGAATAGHTGSVARPSVLHNPGKPVYHSTGRLFQEPTTTTTSSANAFTTATPSFLSSTFKLP